MLSLVGDVVAEWLVMWSVVRGMARYRRFPVLICHPPISSSRL